MYLRATTICCMVVFMRQCFFDPLRNQLFSGLYSVVWSKNENVFFTLTHVFWLKWLGWASIVTPRLDLGTPNNYSGGVWEIVCHMFCNLLLGHSAFGCLSTTTINIGGALGDVANLFRACWMTVELCEFGAGHAANNT